MNYYVKGILIEKMPGNLIIENNGIAFSFKISMSTYNNLPEKGEDVLLYTYISIKNEKLDFYGFASNKERNLFFQLIKIPKIGPKTALSVFNTLNPDEFEIAIVNSNVNAIANVKGISKKMANTIVLELSGKIEINKGTLSSDAYDALLVLGFKEKQINEVLREVMEIVNDIDNTELIIKEALKRLK